jgi:hypothetical protein
MYRINNLRIVYWSITNLTNNFTWHLIEGSNRIGEESIDLILSDDRVKHYKIDTNYYWGHEQRNYFINNIKGNDNDWCFFLDDDNTLTQDLIETTMFENDNDCDVILLSQKKGLTEKIRLWGYEGHLKLGMSDIASFVIRYKAIKRTKIPYESERNADGHYAEQLTSFSDFKIKYYPEKFTRYNTLSQEIT